MYAWHWLMHSTSVGWRFQLAHHTERAMNVSTAYRFHTVEVLVSNVPKIFLIWIFGISPVCYLLYEVVYAIELIFQHSNWDLPYKVDRLLSHFIVTPNYHRLHHSRQMDAARSNYASMFTFWDGLFNRRRYPASPRTIELGVTQETKVDMLSVLKLPYRDRGGS
jgi:sterol desaturase/sphingolipid hydroxylase (fatty acid hydroxylase superfamily)